MRAALFEKAGEPLRQVELPSPTPGHNQLLLRVGACAVCRTDLHIVDGELAYPKQPLIPGHQIVGTVVELGKGVSRFHRGDRIGVPWLGWTCGACSYCRNDQENLCDLAKFTGYTLDGGYAEYTVAEERYCFPIAESYSDAQAAPLLCAGLIGYRGLVKAGSGKRLGLYGFGAAAHIVAQVARYQQREIFALPSRATSKGNASRAISARSGPVVRTNYRRRSSTPQSFSRRPASSCRRRSKPLGKVESSSAPVSI